MKSKMAGIKALNTFTKKHYLCAVLGKHDKRY